jgi:Ca2+-binding EF-hand superfamily protein
MIAWLLGSSTKSEAQLQAERAFTSLELKQLDKQFHSHATSKGNMSKEAFVKLCGLVADELSNGLWWAVTQGRSDAEELPLADLIIAKAKIERMGKEEALGFTFRILCGLEESSRSETRDLVSAAAMSRGLKACFRLSTGQSVTEEEIRSVLAGISPSSDSISLDDYTRLHKSFPSLYETLASLLSRVEPVTDSHGPSKIPQQLISKGVKPLLRPLDIWLLSSCLSPDLTQEWSLIFNSDKDGLSFNTMMGRLGKCQAPSLIVIKDKGGFCFGGFAPVPWAKSGQFFGDASTFVFGLRPKLCLSRATGMNTNFQWCGVGFNQLANGIGFGGSSGQHSGHFSVFVDSQLENGMSRPIATFGNDCFASSQVFQVDSIECWQLKPNEAEPPTSRRPGGGGALSEKNAVDRAFLATAGVQVNHSAGLSNEPIE